MRLFNFNIDETPNYVPTNQRHITQHLKDRVLQCLDECLNIAQEKLQITIPEPTVYFNQRGKIAGSARLQINQIRLNPTLLKDNPDRFCQEVIPHELAHLIVFQLYGRARPHGKEWKNIMESVFNVPAQTRHDMDVSKVVGKTFNYRCQCGPVVLSIRRHNKVLRGQQYQCRACMQPLHRDLKTIA
jgi:SprT protein